MQLCTFARDLALEAVDHVMEAAGMALSGASHNHSHSHIFVRAVRPLAVDRLARLSFVESESAKSTERIIYVHRVLYICCRIGATSYRHASLDLCRRSLFACAER